MVLSKNRQWTLVLISGGIVLTWWLTNTSTVNFNTAINQKNIILQTTPNGCGYAAMEYMVKYYGGSFSKSPHLNQTPLSMMDLVQLAEKYGLEARGVFCSLIELPTLKLPCIVLLKEHHYVVLESISNVGYAVIMDPAYGRKRVSWEDFFTEWEGMTLLVHHPETLLEQW